MFTQQGAGGDTHSGLMHYVYTAGDGGDMHSGLMHYVYTAGEDDDGVDMDSDDVDPNAGRFVRYQFTPQFLKLRCVGAT